MNIGITLLHDLAQVPLYAHRGDSGADLYSIEQVTLYPGERARIRTGISLDIPFGYEAQVRSRSGLADKYGIAVLNSPGTVDSSYGGEIGVILINHGSQDFTINVGDRIAQLVIAAVASEIVFSRLSRTSEAQSFGNPSTTRGTAGFGSTGV
jgi:dUTP pyrophosphatase